MCILNKPQKIKVSYTRQHVVLPGTDCLYTVGSLLLILVLLCDVCV